MSARNRQTTATRDSKNRHSSTLGSAAIAFAGACGLVIVGLLSGPESEGYRDAQAGLLTVVLFSALFLPLRVRWWLAVKRDDPSRRRARWGSYFSSGRLFVDLSLALAVVTLIFLLDPALWPQHLVGISSVTITALISLAIHVFAKRRWKNRQ